MWARILLGVRALLLCNTMMRICCRITGGMSFSENIRHVADYGGGDGLAKDAACGKRVGAGRKKERAGRLSTGRARPSRQPATCAQHVWSSGRGRPGGLLRYRLPFGKKSATGF